MREKINDGLNVYYGMTESELEDRAELQLEATKLKVIELIDKHIVHLDYQTESEIIDELVDVQNEIAQLELGDI